MVRRLNNNNNDRRFAESRKSFKCSRFAEEMGTPYDSETTYTLMGTDEDGSFVSEINSLYEDELIRGLKTLLRNNRIYQVGLYPDNSNDCIDVFTRYEDNLNNFEFDTNIF